VERWTVTESFAGRHRPHIVHGGKPYWCMFDYAVSPVPECDGVEVCLAAGADEGTAEWFPHIRRGILRGYEAARNHGREPVGIRVEIRKVHTHPIDTTAPGCERYGYSFMVDLVQHRCVKLPE